MTLANFDRAADLIRLGPKVRERAEFTEREMTVHNRLAAYSLAADRVAKAPQVRGICP
jgi:hypothetical protein